MTKNKTIKNKYKKRINILKKKLLNSLSIIIIDFYKIKGIDITEFRKICYINNIYICVINNNLLLRIIKKTKLEIIKNILIGSTLIVCSFKHPGTAARLLNDFIKNKILNIKIKGAYYNNKIYSNIEFLVKYPTVNEIIYKLFHILKYEIIGKFINCLILLKEKNENK